MFKQNLLLAANHDFLLLNCVRLLLKFAPFLSHKHLTILFCFESVSNKPLWPVTFFIFKKVPTDTAYHQCFMEYLFLTIHKLARKALVMKSFFNQSCTLRPTSATLLKRGSILKCFNVSSVKFFRITPLEHWFYSKQVCSQVIDFQIKKQVKSLTFYQSSDSMRM